MGRVVPSRSVSARRMALGWSVVRLAAAAGVNRGTVASVEAGRKCYDQTLARIERALADAEEGSACDRAG